MHRSHWHQPHRSVARRLGLDRNPLRDLADRVETAVRLLVVLLAIVSLPVAAAFGVSSDHRGLRAAAAQRVERHEVDATLVTSAGSSNSGMAQLASATARWQVGRTTHTGTVSTTVGATAGSHIKIWIDRSGTPTTPPLTASEVTVNTVVTCAVGELVVLSALGVGEATATCVSRGRRRARLDREWALFEPYWAGRRG